MITASYSAYNTHNSYNTAVRIQLYEYHEQTHSSTKYARTVVRTLLAVCCFVMCAYF